MEEFEKLLPSCNRKYSSVLLLPEKAFKLFVSELGMMDLVLFYFFFSFSLSHFGVSISISLFLDIDKEENI